MKKHHANFRKRLESHFDGLRRSAGTVAGNWQAYAAVTGSALAMATNASAQIIYTKPATPVTAGPILSAHYPTNATAPTNLRVGHNTGTNPLNPYATAQVNFGPKAFDIGVSQFVGDNLFGAHVWVNGHSGVGFLHSTYKGVSSGIPFTATNPYLAQLPAGIMVSANAGHFFKGTNYLVHVTYPLCNCVGNAQQIHRGREGYSADTGFAGFSFSQSTTLGGTRKDYGWVRLALSGGANFWPNEIQAIDWAYDAGGNPIAAGDTGVSATPEPATGPLAILAAGALGVAALRRRKQAA